MVKCCETERLQLLTELVNSDKCRPYKDKLKVDIDPGTANMAIVVVDKRDNPIAAISSG